MVSRLEQYFSQPAGFFKLWAGVLIGPIAWALHLQISYMLVPWACENGWQFIMHLVTLGSLGLAIVGGLIAWSNLKRTGMQNGGNEGSSRFLAYTGLLSSGLFMAVIIAQGIPNFIVSACL